MGLAHPLELNPGRSICRHQLFLTTLQNDPCSLASEPCWCTLCAKIVLFRLGCNGIWKSGHWELTIMHATDGPFSYLITYEPFFSRWLKIQCRWGREDKTKHSMDHHTGQKLLFRVSRTAAKWAICSRWFGRWAMNQFTYLWYRIHWMGSQSLAAFTFLWSAVFSTTEIKEGVNNCLHSWHGFEKRSES